MQTIRLDNKERLSKFSSNDRGGGTLFRRAVFDLNDLIMIEIGIRVDLRTRRPIWKVLFKVFYQSLRAHPSCEGRKH